MREVYLHVGPVKTGSTFLQDLLWRYRDDLARQGYHHPGTHADEMWLAANDLQDAAFVHFEMPEASGVWPQVCERVLTYDGPSVISQETLGLSTEEHIDRIVSSLEPARLHVIVMARSLAAMLPSMWQQNVRDVHPAGVRWPLYLALQRQSRAAVTDTLLIVQRWLTHVPAERIHVVTVPPAGATPAVLLSRFADVLGIETSFWSAEGAARNISIDMVQCEVIRRLNRTSAACLDIRGQRRLVKEALLPLLGPPNPARRIRLPSSQREWIEGESRRRVDGLVHSGAVLHGDLDDLASPPDLWQDGPVGVTEADIVEEALQLLVSSHCDRSGTFRLDLVHGLATST